MLATEAPMAGDEQHTKLPMGNAWPGLRRTGTSSLLPMPLTGGRNQAGKPRARRSGRAERLVQACGCGGGTRDGRAVKMGGFGR
jgi:hypothetical protein